MLAHLRKIIIKRSILRKISSHNLSIRVADPDPVFLHGSGSGFQISLDPDPDPDPVSKFSGSGFSQDSGKLQKGL